MATKTKKTKAVKPKSNINLNADDPSGTLAPAGSKRLLPGANAQVALVNAAAENAYRQGVALAEDLLRGNWTPPKNLALQGSQASFNQARFAYGEAQKASVQATQTFDALQEEALDYRFQLVRGLRTATQGTENPIQDDRLHLSPTRKSEKLVQWFRDVLNQVATHQVALAATLGSDPVALTQEHASKLAAGLAEKKESRRLLPDAKQKQRDAKVKLVGAINEQRMAAGIAFPRNKEIQALFVPDWEKKRVAKSTAVTPGSGDTAAPSAPPGPQTPAVPAQSAVPAAPATPAVPTAPAVPELPVAGAVAAAASAAAKPAEAALAKPGA